MQAAMSEERGAATKKAYIMLAQEFKFMPGALDGAVQKYKKGNGGFIGLQCGVDDGRKPKVQFCMGGNIPTSFGVVQNQYGKTVFTFNVADESEYKGMRAAEDQLLETAKQKKDVWFEGDGVDDADIERSFNRMLSKRKPKNDGGVWPSTFKADFPTKRNESDTAPLCKIIDYDGTPLSVHDLPGRKWQVVVVELGSVYFKGTKIGWGVGSKTISQIILQRDPNDFKEEIELLPFPGMEHFQQQQQHSEQTPPTGSASRENDDEAGDAGSNKKRKIDE